MEGQGGPNTDVEMVDVNGPKAVIPFTDIMHLWDPYSLIHVCPEAYSDGHIFQKQIDAMQKVLTDPTAGWGGQMRGVHKSQQKNYLKSLGEVIGFAVKHLHKEPKMELLLDNDILLAFEGFQLARKNHPGTMKRIYNHVSFMLKFVISSSCPGAPGSHRVTRNQIANIQNWYKDKNSEYKEKQEHEQQKEPFTVVTLLSLWDAAEAEWASFILQFEVRSN